jgi:hypothetical protein
MKKEGKVMCRCSRAVCCQWISSHCSAWG